jgi:pyruvate/2-oxoglutarate dehydrogenase complex dihydrolipoamide dehydrogenase (E3) component
LAQAFRRLGGKVDLISATANLLPNDEPEAGELIRRRFEREGLRLHLGSKAVPAGGGVTVQGPAGTRELPYTALVLGTGRKANVEQLGLEAARCASAGVATTRSARPAPRSTRSPPSSRST